MHDVIGLWAELESGPFLTDHRLLLKMMDVIGRIGGLLPLSIGIGAPDWKPDASDRSVWGSALIIRQDGTDGGRFNQERLIAQARMTLIWIFGGEDHGTEFIELPAFLEKERKARLRYPALYSVAL